MLQPKEYHICSQRFTDISYFTASTLYITTICLAKARQRNFTKNLLDQLKQVIDYVMEYKIRDIVRISSTKQMKNFE